MKVSRAFVSTVSLLAVLLVVSLVAVPPVHVAAQSRADASKQHDRDDQSSERESREIAIGFRIAPVRLTFNAEDRELVGLGSYIVNGQGACNDCHTNPSFVPGRDPFQGQPEKINKKGYLAGGQLFGPFVSRNITPDEKGRPAGLTFVQFEHVLRTGIDPDQQHPQISPFLQVMPWPVYGKMTQHDLRAIYTYLKAIPSIASDESDESSAPSAPALSDPPSQP